MSLHDLRDQLWWSEADQAELDLLTRELVRAAFAHHDACSVCSAGGPWCRTMEEAVEIVLDWRAGRILHSKAAYLRLRQDLREALAA